MINSETVLESMEVLMRWEKSVCGGGVGAVESKSKMLNQELEYGSAIADDNVRGESM